MHGRNRIKVKPKRKRKLSEDSDSSHDEDKLSVCRHFDISYYHDMCNETQIEHDWLEITKSLEAVKTINFPLYGIPSKKPKLNRTHNEESQILQSTSKSTDYLQDIIEKLSVLSSQNRQELEKALSSYDLTMKTFVKNIHQMIFNLNRLNCLQSNIGLSTSTNTHMTENQTLINVFDEMSLVAL